MPRISSSGATNDPLGRWDALRHGTSSSTSESTPARSGTSGTTDPPSPAPDVESRSSKDQPPKPACSSADTTDGSGQETGSSPLSLSASSAASAAPREATPDQVLEAELDAPEPEPAVEPYAGLSGFEAMELARKEYVEGNYDEAERLLAVAESRGEEATAVGRARSFIAEARARAGGRSPAAPGGTGAGPSEEDPTAGGALVP